MKTRIAAISILVVSFILIATKTNETKSIQKIIKAESQPQQISIETIVDQKNDPQAIKKVEELAQYQDEEKLKQIEEEFDSKISQLDEITAELNKYAVSGNAPEDLKKEYQVIRKQMIQIHINYLKRVNREIDHLSKKGSTL